MKKSTRFSPTLVILTLISISAGAAENPFLGRWALTLPDNRAGWLSVEKDGAGYKSHLLWGGGSVSQTTKTKIEGDTLTIEDHSVRVRKRTVGKKTEETRRKHIEHITARVDGDNLALIHMVATAKNPESTRRPFTGKRIPPLPPKPDLSKVKYGKTTTLFDGTEKSKDNWILTNTSQTDAWSVKNGVLVNKPVQKEGGKRISYGNLRTKEEFEDFNLKLEVNVPEKGNSGIYLRGVYEVQVSDSYDKGLDSHNMGGIYSRIKPTVKAERKAGQWQKYDITLLDRHVTVKLNGKTIIDNQPLLGCTGGALWSDEFIPGPIYLQGDHTAVSYRNIVLTPIIKPKVLFEDTFDGKLGEGWTWLREEKNAWRIKDNALEIQVQPGVAHNVKNALVRKSPDRSKVMFAVDVTVTNTTVPIQQYEQAGITWYSNGKPVFKLVKELVDGQLMIIPSRKPMTSRTVQLRLMIQGAEYVAAFRPNGEGEFQIAKKGTLPPPGNDQISIQCYNGPPDAEHWIRFDDFRITELTD
ncbi:MAG: 3-keto-disaccharide hydrolase [Planctomycetota bacterium]|jgi:hypothetical protein